jgi:hypothetical protein
MSAFFNYKEDAFRYEVIYPLKDTLDRYKGHRKTDAIVDLDDSEVNFAKSLSEETMSAFEEGLKTMKAAYAYAHAIDYLLEGDDNEESFHRRLKHDLEMASVNEEDITDEFECPQNTKVFRIFTPHSECVYACGYREDEDGYTEIEWKTIYSIETKPEHRREGHADVLLDYLKDGYYGPVSCATTGDEAVRALMEKHHIKIYDDKWTTYSV